MPPKRKATTAEPGSGEDLAMKAAKNAKRDTTKPKGVKKKKPATTPPAWIQALRKSNVTAAPVTQGSEAHDELEDKSVANIYPLGFTWASPAFIGVSTGMRLST